MSVSVDKLREEAGIKMEELLPENTRESLITCDLIHRLDACIFDQQAEIAIHGERIAELQTVANRLNKEMIILRNQEWERHDFKSHDPKSYIQGYNDGVHQILVKAQQRMVNDG